MTPSPPGFWRLLWSALCALVGVQSERNRLRDFSQQRPLPFLLAGLVVTLAFIALVVGLVQLSLRLL